MLPIIALSILLALPLAGCGDVDRAKAVRSESEHEPRRVRPPTLSRVHSHDGHRDGDTGGRGRSSSDSRSQAVSPRSPSISEAASTEGDAGAAPHPSISELRVRQAEAAHDQARSRLGLAVGGREGRSGRSGLRAWFFGGRHVAVVRDRPSR
jgi:hypothetical protein